MTPNHTIEALERAIAGADLRNGARFVNIDTRVLEWLIADSRALATATTKMQSMEDALLIALPYVEDAVGSIDFKPGVVKVHAAMIRNEITPAQSCANTGEPDGPSPRTGRNLHL